MRAMALIALAMLLGSASAQIALIEPKNGDTLAITARKGEIIRQNIEVENTSELAIQNITPKTDLNASFEPQKFGLAANAKRSITMQIIPQKSVQGYVDLNGQQFQLEITVTDEKDTISAIIDQATENERTLTWMAIGALFIIALAALRRAM